MYKNLSWYAMIFVCLFFMGGFSSQAIADFVNDGERDAERDKTIAQIKENFRKSLHGTRRGKAQFYRARHGGFETLTGIRYKDLACKNCHAPTLADGTPVDPVSYEPSCADCHDFQNKGTKVDQQTCLGCHSRQGAEHMLFSDVHRDNGIECTDCHKSTEIHGDIKKEHRSLHEKGVIEANCVNCHTEDWLEIKHPKPVTAYHADTVDCTACHVKSVIACESCHFESELEGNKRFYGPPPHKDFKLLMQRDGKVRTATYQSLTHQGTSFYVIAPYTAHSITKDDIKCGDCHLTEEGGNAAVNEYVKSKMLSITVTEWDGEKLNGPEGVIPVPPYWQDVLKFDFVMYTGSPNDPQAPFDPTKWARQRGPDMTQMRFGSPLSEKQMNALIGPLPPKPTEEGK